MSSSSADVVIDLTGDEDDSPRLPTWIAKGSRASVALSGQVYETTIETVDTRNQTVDFRFDSDSIELMSIETHQFSLFKVKQLDETPPPKRRLRAWA